MLLCERSGTHIAMLDIRRLGDEIAQQCEAATPCSVPVRFHTPKPVRRSEMGTKSGIGLSFNPTSTTSVISGAAWKMAFSKPLLTGAQDHVRWDSKYSRTLPGSIASNVSLAPS